MRNLKQFGRSLALVALMIVTALAQNPIPPDVNILIQPRQVQFVAQKAIQEMRFQVFDQQGNLVYDSGTLTEPELKWGLRHGNGGELEGGLYAYKLTIKEQGKDAAQEKRGHFIIERAAEQKADRLWITSPATAGVGTDVQGAELTVATTEQNTVAGSKNRKDSAKTPADAGEKADPSKLSATAFNNTSTGTINRIAKWVATDKIGDSVLYELNGNVGIGTTAPVDKLTVRTGSASYGMTHTDGIATVSSWVGSFASQPAGWYGTKSNHPLHFFVNGGNPSLTIGTNSNVGIGTTNPFARLQVTTTTKNAGDNTATFAAPTIGSNLSHIHYGTTGDWFIRSAASGGKVVLQDTGGNVGIGTFNPTEKLQVVGNGLFSGNVGIGTNAPSVKLTVQTAPHGHGLSHTNGTVAVGTYVNAAGGWIQTHSTHPLFLTTGDTIVPHLTVATSGNLGIGTTTPTERLHVAGNGLFNGTLKTNVLQILGGSDLSEQFDINATTDAEAASNSLQPGLVVSIDPANSGKLAVSTQAYDRKVAGIISGAGGVNTGMMMGQTGSIADGKYPVALTGRVYCWVDASNGPVMPGDLLTTSNTPGYAMKAVDSTKAQGAIIGKAMTELKEGHGLVLVLVTLQ